jgi:hypothetical protein
MERELSELDLQTVIFFEFLDTPGDEVAPGSDEIRENFEDEGLWHVSLLSLSFRPFQSIKRPESNRYISTLCSSDAGSQKVLHP